MLRQISGHGPLFARLACALLFLCAATAGNAAKTPPTATLTSPASGASFFAPATIELAATASDPDGTVVRVDFFQGTTLIGTATSEPFTATWSNVPAGNYTLTAKAIDNAGLTGTSAPVPITVNSATALLITSPGDGAALDIASGLTVTGTFEGEATTILVDNENSTILATVSGSSFSASFFDQPLAVGSNTITARLARPDRTAVTRSISVAGYDVPVVAFTSPAADTFAAPADILLGVDAKAPGGAVTQVDFYNGSELLSTVTTPPYQFNWTNVPFGTYTISARATSSHGPIGSATTIINVSGPNTLPTISITSPTEGAVFPNQSNIPLAVDANDPDGTVVTVEYFANGGLIGASNVAPFSLTWSNVATGSYALTARATDNREGQTTSAPVNITVAPPNQPPTVEISSPTSGSSFSVPGPVTLTATASDPDGTINRVEYYHGTTLIGSATTAPYAVNWTMVVPGTYQLTAKAFDNQGGDGVSQPITVTISGSVTYLHSDFAGNPIAATDVNGAILWKENFRPYGDRLNNQPAAAGNRQWFHGKAADADTGLSYFGARYYDATVGRFMGVDAKRFSEDDVRTFNRFGYGANNPYKYLDPDGNYYGLVIGFAVVGGLVYISGGFQATKPPSGLGGRPNQGDLGSSIMTTPGTAPESVSGNPPPGLSELFDKLGNLIFTEKQPGGAFPDRPLPRDPKSGKPVPESDAPHTQLGTRGQGERKYPQAREFGERGKHVRDIDFTDHGRPDTHPNPHQHRIDPQTGKRGGPEPLR